MKKLTRYMDFAKFVNLMQEGIHMTTPHSFEDKWEGMIILNQLSQEGHSGLRDAVDEYFSWLYVCCWHGEEYESHAMWKLYGKIKESIAIVISKEKIEKAILEQYPNTLAYCDNIKYVDPNSIPSSNKTTYCISKINISDSENPTHALIDNLFLKHKSYECENEFRFVILDPQYEENSKNKRNGIYLKILDLNKFIEKIIVSPFAEEWFFETVSKVAKLYGLHCDIEFSSLIEPKFD